MLISEYLSTVAWAAAENSHNREDVGRLVEEAVAIAEAAHEGTGQEMWRPAVAGVHYRCRWAYLALEDQAKATHHFTEASRLDPMGTSGRKAQAAQISTR